MMRSYSIGFPSVSPFVKALVFANIGAWFFLVLIVQQFFLDKLYIFYIFGLVPSSLSQGFLWQMFTYMFIHSSGVFHILFNMLILWMFGSELERLWGSKFFLIYYLTCGAGAAVIYSLALLGASFFTPVEHLVGVPVVGSSGAVFGLMLAYGLIFKNRILYVMMIFPMRAGTFVYFLAGIEILSLLSSGLSGPVANLAHLGGLVTGIIFLFVWRHWGKIPVFLKRKKFQQLHIVKPESSEKKQTWH